MTHFIYLFKMVTLDFDRDRKSMSVYCNVSKGGKSGSSKSSKGGNSNVLYVKGAPESVLERCTHVRLHPDGSSTKMTSQLRSSILEMVNQYGNVDALRVLALAVLDDPLPFEKYDFSDSSKFPQYESNLTFIGLVGMLDPPRPEVRSAIETCYKAGIRVIVITGDNKASSYLIVTNCLIFISIFDFHLYI